MQYVRPMALNSHKWVHQEMNMIQNIPTPSVLIELLQSAIATFQHLPRHSIFVCFREQNYGIEDNSLEIDGNWNTEFPFWKASIIYILNYFLPSVRRGLLDRCCCSRFASGTDAKWLGGFRIRAIGFLCWQRFNNSFTADGVSRADIKNRELDVGPRFHTDCCPVTSCWPRSSLDLPSPVSALGGEPRVHNLHVPISSNSSKGLWQRH